MVDEHPLGWRTEQGRLHILHTTGGVVVETEHEVCYLEEHVGLFTMLVVTHDLLAVGHPLQEVGILVGHYHHGILVEGAQVFRPS